MSDRRAIIVGHRGQDGRLLTALLRSRGYSVAGFGRIGHDLFGSLPSVAPCSVDRPETIADVVRRIQPHEVYYLAAHHASSQTRLASDPFSEHQAGLATNVSGLLHYLEAARSHAPESRIFYASSSLIFTPLTELTRLDEAAKVGPEEPYGLCKALASEVCRDYRRRGLFVSVGILFNHESHLRPPDFLSMKLIRGALSARRGAPAKLAIGDLNAVVDWGYAPDFVDAFTRILAEDTPDDFVIATGQGHKVSDFAAAAYGHLGLDWENHVLEEPSLLTRRRSSRIGDSSRLRLRTGWEPSMSFGEMVRLLVDRVGLAFYDAST